MSGISKEFPLVGDFRKRALIKAMQPDKPFNEIKENEFS